MQYSIFALIFIIMLLLPLSDVPPDIVSMRTKVDEPLEETLVSLLSSMLQLIAEQAIDTSDWCDSSSFVSVVSVTTDMAAASLGRLTMLIGPRINSSISLQTVILGSTINSINPKIKFKKLVSFD